MNEQESATVRRANLFFRKEMQKREGQVAWNDYFAEEEATRTKTARLRAARLEKQVSTADAPPAKPSRKVALRRAKRLSGAEPSSEKAA